MRVSNMAMNQPGWVWRTAAAFAALVVVLPLIVLFLLALSAAIVVFVILATAATIISRVRSLADRGSGRENVRVVVPREPETAQ